MDDKPLYRTGMIKHLNGNAFRVPEDILPNIAAHWVANGLAEWVDEVKPVSKVREVVNKVQTAAVAYVNEKAVKVTGKSLNVKR